MSNNAYDRCDKIVKMLSVLTDSHDVKWEKVGEMEYKVPVARNYVALEFQCLTKTKTPCIRFKLLSLQGKLLDEIIFTHDDKGYQEVKQLYDAVMRR